MSIIDTVYTYKFIKMLSTPWTKQDAFRLGIIDKEGKILKPAATLTTDEEKQAYTPFHRLAWNLKRMVEKMPGGSSNLINYSSALYLIKEENHMLSKMQMNAVTTAIHRLAEDATNVIGDAGQNPNIAMTDPKLGKKKKKPPMVPADLDVVNDAGYSEIVRRIPAMTNEIDSSLLSKEERLANQENARIKADQKKAQADVIDDDEDDESGVDESFARFALIRESMTRRKKRDANGRVQKFYKRDQACPPGQTKTRDGGCEKLAGDRTIQQVRKTKIVAQRKRKKTLKKKSAGFWRLAQMRRKKTQRA